MRHRWLPFLVSTSVAVMASLGILMIAAAGPPLDGPEGAIEALVASSSSDPCDTHDVALKTRTHASLNSRGEQLTNAPCPPKDSAPASSSAESPRVSDRNEVESAS